MVILRASCALLVPQRDWDSPETHGWNAIQTGRGAAVRGRS